MVKPITIPISYRSDPKGLRQAEKDLKGFASGIGKTVLGATAAVAGIGIASIKAFADFDAAMNQSIAIMGNVSDTLRGDMSDAAREVAKTTTFSAEQAAESYFFLASAGLDAEQSIAALPVVARFAQAGMFDMATATDLLTDAQSALGLTSDDTAENLENMAGLGDVLVKANTLANASVSQFSEALTNKAGASMRSLNIDMEEGVAVLAVFADQGIKGSEAGTTFNATIRGLTQGVAKNAEEFAEMGIEVFNAQGEMNNMADIVGDMEGALDGMSVEQQRATLSQLGFTEETLAGALALIGNSEKLREYEGQLRDAGGTAEDVANKQLQTFSAQLGILGDFVTDVGISIGQELGPVMEDLVEQLKPVIEEIGAALIPAFKALTPSIGLLVGALPGLITALIPILPVMVDIAAVVLELGLQLLPIFLEVINLLLPGLSQLTAFMVENSSAVATAALVIGGLVIAFQAFNTIARISQLATLAFSAAKGIATVAVKAFNLALKANPIGIVITLIAALIAGLVYFFTQTEFGQKIWEIFSEFFLSTVQAIGDLFSYIFTEWLPGIWQGFVDYLGSAWEGFKDGFFTVLGAVGDFFKNAINGYIGMFESFVNFFLSGINLIIRGLNKIKVNLPGTPFTPPLTIGVNIPEIPKISIPRLAEGGIVPARPGGILANIGEGRFDEAVVPLDGKNRFGSTVNITVNAGMGTNGNQVGEQIVNAIRRYERSSGPVFARA
jgi:TP901 family phage tail tape measure protein